MAGCSIEILFPLALCFLSLTTMAAAVEIDVGIGIGIGSGGDSPSPSPPEPCSCSPPAEPQPSDFPNLKQFMAYKVIQRFKQTITCDPNNVTQSWVGYRPCTYQGFFCDTPPGLTETPTIASVDFNGFQLSAPTIAGFVDQLPDLALFHANSNNFTGTIPDLSHLPFIYELDVSNNNMSGPFPANVLPLNQLTFLDLRFNLFAGTVPSSVFQLDLDVLFLNNNFFSQNIPADIFNTPVVYLTLANNGFTGPLPANSICNAANTLKEVLFLNNRLSGCLPYQIGLLRKATVFDVGFNRITGPIPFAFGCLKNIEQLNLAGNLLYGQVPDVVCRLAKVGNLANLSLSGNYFTSLGSSCRELIKKKVLDVRQNCIPGLPDQRPLAECAWFFQHAKYYCPLFRFIPCSLHKRDGGGDQALSLPSPPFVLAKNPPAPKSKRPSPAFMTYNALNHRRRGN